MWKRDGGVLALTLAFKRDLGSLRIIILLFRGGVLALTYAGNVSIAENGDRFFGEKQIEEWADSRIEQSSRGILRSQEGELTFFKMGWEQASLEVRYTLKHIDYLEKKKNDLMARLKEVRVD
ncbi:uncharacterized protein G2W53_009515 [Senna tora]|uniref:Uncharacterized protein n=1 Tax=Senna tora TaxID=362788 RepID=A0A835C843_9FABA|nr:uncharacterized protein G2W53_009515 [Senna tora]